MKSLSVKRIFVIFSVSIAVLGFSLYPQQSNASILDTLNDTFNTSEQAFSSTLDSFTKGLNVIPDQSASVFSAIKDLFGNWFGTNEVPVPSEPVPALREREDVPPSSESLPPPSVSQYLNVTAPQVVREYITSPNAVTTSLLYSELNSLETRLRRDLGSSQSYGQSSGNSTSNLDGYVTANTFERQVDAILSSLENSIDNVESDIDAISVEADPDPEFDSLTVTGATTLGTLTGPLQAINGLVSATSTLSTFYGGTGLSTLPSYGNILVGNAAGGYTLTATSSLGLTGLTSQWTTSGSDIYYATGNVGVGTTSPAAKLSVAGTAGGTTPVFLVSTSTAGFATTTVFQINSLGNTIIGATTSALASDALTVHGTLRLTHSSNTNDEAYIKAGTTTSGNGMNLFLQGGNHNDINGAEIQLRGSNANTGGSISLQAAGNSSLTNGGNVNLTAGSAGSHNGATLSVSGATSGEGGGVSLQGGSTSGGRGGKIQLQGGSGASRGYITLQEGGGFVGIGSSTPSAVLSVRGAGTGTGRLFALSDSGDIEKFSVLDNGNTIIGATTTSYANDVLTVHGTLRLTHSSNTNDEVYIKSGTTTSGNGMNLYLQGGAYNTTSGAELQLRGSNSGSGGSVSLMGGSGSVSNGGGLNFNAGGSSSGNGGATFSMSGGNSSTGGDVTLQAGNTSSGRGASVSITGGSGTCCNQDTRGYVLFNPFNSDAKVGVGTSTPWGQFSINPSGVMNGPSFVIGSTTATQLVVTTTGRLGLGTSSPASTLTVTGSACISRGPGVATAACSTTSGTITANLHTTANADVAERYNVEDTTIKAGEVVALDPDAPLTIKRAHTGDKVFGIISTEPGIMLGASNLDDATTRPVALAGRVPVKFSTENGAVMIGDELTLSSTPGVAMKAPEDGEMYIIGTALENISNNGTVTVFVQSQFIKSLSQSLSIQNTTVGNTETVPESEMMNVFENLLSGVQEWMYGKVSATVGFFKNIFADTVTTNNLEIKGQDGNIYCVVVDHDGVIKTIAGRCVDSEDEDNGSGDSDVVIIPAPSDETEPTPEPETAPEEVTEEPGDSQIEETQDEPTPEPEIVSEPTPEPEVVSDPAPEPEPSQDAPADAPETPSEQP